MRFALLAFSLLSANLRVVRSTTDLAGRWRCGGEGLGLSSRNTCRLAVEYTLTVLVATGRGARLEAAGNSPVTAVLSMMRKLFLLESTDSEL